MKIKSYTDLEQSKKLAEILPIESADMHYPLPCSESNIPVFGKGGFGSTPCWSLTALLEVIPYPSLHKTYLGWRCDSYNKEGTTCKLGEDKNNSIDACYEMVLKLHKSNVLDMEETNKAIARPEKCMAVEKDIKINLQNLVYYDDYYQGALDAARRIIANYVWGTFRGDDKIYRTAELKLIKSSKHNMQLFLDGTRIAYRNHKIYKSGKLESVEAYFTHGCC